jgi:hypothetical protein
VTPPLDPQKTPPAEGLVAEAAGRIGRLRDRLAQPEPGEPPPLESFGRAVLDQLELRVTDVAELGLPAGGRRRVYEEVGRRFLDHVLPAADELARMDAGPVAEYAAVDPDRPDPGRLAAAFGSARLGAFGRDGRLVYRAGGYRGRPGAPLADHLIAEVVRPAAAAVAAAGG